MPRADQQHRPDARTSFLKARATTEEVELVEAAASRLGLSTAGYIRAALLDAARGAQAIPSRHDGPDSNALALVAADRRRVDALRDEIHRCGVNLNQLVRLAHRGEIRSSALAKAVDDVAALCRASIEALGGRSL